MAEKIKTENEELDRLDEELEKAEAQVDIMYVFRFTGIEPLMYLTLCDNTGRHGEYYSIASRLASSKT